MKRLRIEDILKPGAVLEAKVIDFNDPEVKRMFDDCKSEQERIQSLMPENWTQEQWDSLNLVITI